MSTLRKPTTSQPFSSTSRQVSKPSNYKPSPSQSLYKHTTTTSLTQDQYLQIKQAFQLFDPHSTNFITPHELKIILRALGFDIKKSQILLLLKNYDIQQSGGQLSFQDYLQIMTIKYGQKDPIQQTLKAFRLFDQQNKGKISYNDLKRVAKELGETLKEEEIIAMIEQFDRDNDGYIDEEEFLAIIKPSIV